MARNTRRNEGGSRSLLLTQELMDQTAAPAPAPTAKDATPEGAASSDTDTAKD